MLEGVVGMRRWSSGSRTTGEATYSSGVSRLLRPCGRRVIWKDTTG